jgi:adenylate cyclase
LQRRLTAILAADMVGYSRLMGEDEMRTLAALSELRRELFDPIVEARGGQIIKRMGDGWFVAFPNASDAAACAIEVQEGVNGHEIIQLRIGIHIGDVTFQDDDIYGDGVNIAARLEALADAGQVVISDTVHNSLDGKSISQFSGGEVQQLKNISREVQVWHWPGEALSKTASPDVADTLGLPQKPSIAVMPFTNMSNDPEQEYFADGIVEDLITALSRFPWLFVIARNTSFSYKGENVQVKRAAKDLGVRYMVEGSVRRSATRLRVSVQLIDAVVDRHVWAENYDRAVGDLFDLQDEISQAITGVLVPALSSAERERSLRDNRPTLDAWAAYQRALEHYYRPYSDEDHAAARRLLDQSIELDPRFADAHAMVAMMGIYAIHSGQSSYTGSHEEIIAEARRAAERAVQLEDSNALAHIALGRAYEMTGKINLGVPQGETAVKLNPNLAIAHHELGFMMAHVGRLEESIQCFDRAIRLSPNDPSRWNFFLLKGISFFGLQEFDRAIANLEEASRLRTAAFWPYLGLAAAYVAMGRMDDAQGAIGEVLARRSDWTAANMQKIFGNMPSDHLKKWIQNVQLAGLPEK